MGAMLLDARRPARGARADRRAAAVPEGAVRARRVPARRGLPERARDARRGGARSASTTAPPTRSCAAADLRVDDVLAAPHAVLRQLDPAAPSPLPAAGPDALAVAVYADPDGPPRLGEGVRVRGRRVRRRHGPAARRAVRRLDADGRRRGRSGGRRGCSSSCCGCRSPTGAGSTSSSTGTGAATRAASRRRPGENFWHARALAGVSTRGSRSATNAPTSDASRARPRRRPSRRRPTSARSTWTWLAPARGRRERTLAARRPSLGRRDRRPPERRRADELPGRARAARTSGRTYRKACSPRRASCSATRRSSRCAR